MAKCSESFFIDFGATEIPNENTSIPFIRTINRLYSFPSITSFSKPFCEIGFLAPPSGIIMASKPPPSVPK